MFVFRVMGGKRGRGWVQAGTDWANGCHPLAALDGWTGGHRTILRRLLKFPASAARLHKTSGIGIHSALFFLTRALTPVYSMPVW